MARHQYGIFAEGTRAQHHLELVLDPAAGAAELAAAVLATRLAGEDNRANGGVNLVVGFGPEAWSRLLGGATPGDLHDFPGYAAPDGGPTAPATQHDVWIWLHGPSPDVIIDVARAAAAAWDGVASLVLDQPCFVYRDSRDLTGFIDGTANPHLDAAPLVAVIPDGTAGAGGCCAMTMRFVHDLRAFHALPEDEQQQVFGRTRFDSVELPEADLPVDAHVARAEAADDAGEELEVYRRSVPFATVGTQGLHFVAFGADVDRFDRQLRQMYGLAPDGIVDRLLTFTTAESGSFWLCPSVEDLERIAPFPDRD